MGSFRLLGAAAALFVAHAAVAAAAPIEALKAQITPSREKKLACLVDANYDKVVKLDISIAWPEKKMTVEQDSYQRLLVLTSAPDAAEYVFPKGSYAHGGRSYAVSGYFIVRGGGTHQGITSIAFEPVTDATATAEAETVDVTKTRCR
jgi:hypothetical protein